MGQAWLQPLQHGSPGMVTNQDTKFDNLQISRLMHNHADHESSTMNPKQPTTPISSIFKKLEKPTLQSRRSNFKNHQSHSDKALPSLDSSSNAESSSMSQSASENSLISSHSTDSKLNHHRQGLSNVYNSLAEQAPIVIPENRPGTEGCSRRASSESVLSVDDKQQRKRKIKDVRRAEIVAAVTQRLYNTSRKTEVKPEPVIVPEEVKEQPGELQLCANARAKLQELSKKALTANRKIKCRIDENTQTDLDNQTQRVKEKSVGPDIPMETSQKSKDGSVKVKSHFTNTPEMQMPQIPVCIVQNNQRKGTQMTLTTFCTPEDMTHGLLNDLFHGCRNKKLQPPSMWKHFTRPLWHTPVFFGSSAEESFSDDSLETNPDTGTINANSIHELTKSSNTRVVKFSCGQHFNPPSRTSQIKNFTQMNTSSQTDHLLLNSNQSLTNGQLTGIHNNFDNLARSHLQDYLNNFIKDSTTQHQLQNISNPYSTAADDDGNTNDEMEPRMPQTKNSVRKGYDGKQNSGNPDVQPSHKDMQVRNQEKPLKASNVNRPYTRPGTDTVDPLCSSRTNIPPAILNNQMTETSGARNTLLEHHGRHQSHRSTYCVTCNNGNTPTNTPQQYIQETYQCERCGYEFHKCNEPNTELLTGKNDKSGELDPGKVADFTNSLENSISKNSQKLSTAKKINMSELFFMPETNKMFLADCDTLAPLYTVSKKIMYCLGTSHEDTDMRMTLSVSPNLLTKQITTKENLNSLILTNNLSTEDLCIQAAQEIQVHSKIEYHTNTNFQSDSKKWHADRLVDHIHYWENYDNESFPQECETHKSFTTLQKVNSDNLHSVLCRARQHCVATATKHPACAHLCCNCSCMHPNIKEYYNLKNNSSENYCNVQAPNMEHDMHSIEHLPQYQTNVQLQEQSVTQTVNPKDNVTAVELESKQQKSHSVDGSHDKFMKRNSTATRTTKPVGQKDKESFINDSCKNNSMNTISNDNNAVTTKINTSADSFRNFVHKLLPTIRKLQNSNLEYDLATNSDKYNSKQLAKHSAVRSPQPRKTVIHMKDKSISTDVLPRVSKISGSVLDSEIYQTDASVQTQSADTCVSISHLEKHQERELHFSQAEKSNNANTVVNNTKSQIDKCTRVQESNCIFKHDFSPLSRAQEQENQIESDFDDFPDQVLELPRESTRTENGNGDSGRGFQLKNKHPHIQDMHDLILGKNAWQTTPRNTYTDIPLTADMPVKPKKTIKKSVSWTDMRGCGTLHTEIITNDEGKFYNAPSGTLNHALKYNTDNVNSGKQYFKDICQSKHDTNTLAVLSLNGIPKSPSLTNCSVSQDYEYPYHQIPSGKNGNTLHHTNKNLTDIKKLISQTDNEEQQSPAQLFQLSALLSEATSLLKVLNKGSGNKFNNNYKKRMPNTSGFPNDHINETSCNVPESTVLPHCSNFVQHKNKLLKNSKKLPQQKITYKITAINRQASHNNSLVNKPKTKRLQALKGTTVKYIPLSKLMHTKEGKHWLRHNTCIPQTSSTTTTHNMKVVDYCDNNDKQIQRQGTTSAPVTLTQNEKFYSDAFITNKSMQDRKNNTKLCCRKERNIQFIMHNVVNKVTQKEGNEHTNANSKKIIMQSEEEKEVTSENDTMGCPLIKINRNNSSQTQNPMYSDKNIETNDNYEHTVVHEINSHKSSSTITRQDASTQYLQIYNPRYTKIFPQKTVPQPNSPGVTDYLFNGNTFSDIAIPKEFSCSLQSLYEDEPLGHTRVQNAENAIGCLTRKHRSYEFLDRASLPGYNYSPYKSNNKNALDIKHCNLTHHNSDSEINYTTFMNKTMHLECGYGKCNYSCCSVNCPVSGPIWWTRRHGPTKYMKQLVQMRRKVIHETRSQWLKIHPS